MDTSEVKLAQGTGGRVVWKPGFPTTTPTAILGSRATPADITNTETDPTPPFCLPRSDPLFSPLPRHETTQCASGSRPSRRERARCELAPPFLVTPGDMRPAPSHARTTLGARHAAWSDEYFTAALTTANDRPRPDLTAADPGPARRGSGVRFPSRPPRVTRLPAGVPGRRASTSRASHNLHLWGRPWVCRCVLRLNLSKRKLTQEESK